MNITEKIHELFRNRGDSEYGGEVVTQQEHALQCAALAEKAKSEKTLIVAALLHDVGHLLHDLPDDAPDQGVDDQHEEAGYEFLEQHFPPAVWEPVRLHVAAKRYLCTTEPSYHDRLSPPSVQSLKLQGGLMSKDECDAFRSHDHWRAALQLRKWDDVAKTEDLVTPPLEHYLTFITDVISNEIP